MLITTIRSKQIGSQLHVVTTLYSSGVVKASYQKYETHENTCTSLMRSQTYVCGNAEQRAIMDFEEGIKE